MSVTCDRCGSDTASGLRDGRCAACGFDVASWRSAPAESLRESPAAVERLYPTARELFLESANESDPTLAAKTALLLIFAIWSLTFTFRPIADPDLASSFMHRINLVFHEAGHVLFLPFGQLMTILGGSLMQLLIPAIFAVAFISKRDPFAAAIMLWWLGQSAMDLAPYIDDARRMELMLLGGMTGADAPGSHDWNNILGRLDLLRFDHSLALACDLIGRLLMVIALIWGAAALRHALRARRASAAI